MVVGQWDMGQTGTLTTKRSDLWPPGAILIQTTNGKRVETKHYLAKVTHTLVFGLELEFSSPHISKV